MSQAYRALKPGGWIEFQGIYAIPRSDDGTLDRNSSYCELAYSFDDITRRMGCDPDFPTKWKQQLKDAGFKNVTETVFKIPSSPWPKDKRMKKVGAFELMNVVEGASSFMHRGWTKEFGQSKEDLALLILSTRKELLTGKMHAWLPL